MPTADLRRQDARATLQLLVEKAIAQTPVFDIHTHLYAPAFSNLLAAGIDELLTYHYLVSETFRTLEMPYDEFWKLDKAGQAELAWQQLFIENSPISEACRGVLTTLNRLGLDVKQRDLNALRQWFAAWDPDEYISHCMNLANVHKIGMTNSPFDDAERPTWEHFKGDDRFAAGLRLDPLLVDWQNTAKFLAGEGYNVQADFSGQTFAEIRRFLDDWTTRMQPMYAMVSLPPTFAYPDNTECNAILEGAVLPFCREQNLPLALMLGVKRAVNPDLRMAGDGVGCSDLNALQSLLQNHSDNKFLVTVLARENQHELCVLARKFRNLHVFGCWWFVNTPLLIEETTRMRLELIGPTFTPQHSDARVIDQIIYKWDHTRSILTDVLTDKYVDVAVTGWNVTPQEIERDVKSLLGGGFEAFIAR